MGRGDIRHRDLKNVRYQSRIIPDQLGSGAVARVVFSGGFTMRFGPEWSKPGRGRCKGRQRKSILGLSPESRKGRV